MVSVGGDPPGLTLRSLDNGEVLHRFLSETNGVEATALSPGGRLLAVSGAFWDRSIRLFDLASHEELVSVPATGERTIALEFTADGRRLLSAEAGGRVRVIPLQAGLRAHSWMVGGPLAGLIQCPASPETALYWRGRSLRVFDFETGEIKDAFWGPAREIRCVATCASTGWVALGGTGPQIGLLDPREPRTVHRMGLLWSQSPRGYKHLAFSPDGRWLAAAADRAPLVLFDLTPLLASAEAR